MRYLFIHLLPVACSIAVVRCLLDCMYLQVLKKNPDFRRRPWPTISNSAKDFVKKLLVKDPRARLTAAQALCKYLSFLMKKGALYYNQYGELNNLRGAALLALSPLLSYC